MSDTVILSRQEYEDLIDARDHAVALRDVATGAMETLTEAEMDAYLAAPTPLAFWRRRRGLTQAALAATVGITQPYLAQIETGKRSGDVRLYARLAKALRVRIEDLVAE
ncbi:helix-turn-helix domain-containing protein [Crenalkalicoccus roseus]|uniref:helix-turn-helix domain-containing protein n=1 Tax=Crenalkalicoccus roseus TaxID=1485588 RepID=UPI00107FEDDB|nr:helix-turn-helix transcriptional regulator [Crenalkalicoccus roseus]